MQCRTDARLVNNLETCVDSVIESTSVYLLCVSCVLAIVEHSGDDS